MKKLKDILNELTAADQAHQMGLEYGGYAQWVDPKTRETKAKTVDGKLVKVDGDDDDEEKEDLGRIIVFDLDDAVLSPNIDLQAAPVRKYIQLVKASLRPGAEHFVMVARNSKEDAAKFFQKAGIVSGIMIVPIGSADPHKKKQFVEKKIRAGYTDIEFFDNDQKCIAAVNSLKATFNRLDVNIDATLVPSLRGETNDPEKLAAANPRREN